MEQKRISIFLPGLYDGGAERTMLNLADGLVADGFGVDLVLSQAEGPFLKEVSSSIRLVELNSKHLQSRRALSSFPSLIRYIRTERPQILLSALNYANIIAVWAKYFARVPFRLLICEQNNFSSESAELNFLYKWILNFLVKHSYPKADEIIAVSEGVADDLARVINIPRDDVKVVFNPIIFPEMKIKKEAPFADPWFDTGQPPVILAIGRLTKQKGFDTLIRAFSEVRKQRQVHLLILGEGEDRVPLTNLIKELNLGTEVRLPGFVSNPYPYLVNASLFVLSSRWEGLPTVLVEALYCEVPIIATDCPSGSREILKDGKYGRLVPVEDIDGLIREINSVLDGNRAAITPDSWQPFESTTVIRQYEKLMLGISG